MTHRRSAVALVILLGLLPGANGFGVIGADATRLTMTLLDTTGLMLYEETIKKP